MLKRIHEYEKFLENCKRLKRIEKKKQEELRKKRRNTMFEGMFMEPKVNIMLRSKSLSYLEIIKPTEEEERKLERFSLPPLPACESITSLTLEDKIFLWHSCGCPYPKSGWTRLTSPIDLCGEKRIKFRKFKEVALLLWIITSLFQRARRRSRSD